MNTNGSKMERAGLAAPGALIRMGREEEQEQERKGWVKIAQEIVLEQAPGIRVMEFAHGLSIRMARRFEAKGYRQPSPSMIEDAEGAVIERICQLWIIRGVEEIDWTRVRPGLARDCGCIAARFLTRIGAGMTGRKGKRQNGERPDTVPLSAAGLAVERAALEAWARGEAAAMLRTEEEQAALEQEHEHQRRAAARWVWSSLVHALERGLTPVELRQPARQAAIRAATKRATLIVRLVYADNMLEAAARAGFASARSAAESLRRDRTFERLAASAEDLPHMIELRRRLRAAGLAVKEAVQQERHLVMHAGVHTENEAAWKAATERRMRSVQTARRIKHEMDRARQRLAAHWAGAAKGLWKGSAIPSARMAP